MFFKKNWVVKSTFIQNFGRKIEGLFKDFKGKNQFFKDSISPQFDIKYSNKRYANLCTAVLSNFLVCKTTLFNWGYFIQGAFIFKEYHGKIFSKTYKDFSNFKDSSRTWCSFKDYSRPVRTMLKPCTSILIKFLLGLSILSPYSK